MDAEGKVALLQDYSNVSANTDEKILNMAKNKKTKHLEQISELRQDEWKPKIRFKPRSLSQ